jgi:peptidoglycan/LPS O-acetylase OafA/YrhL
VLTSPWLLALLLVLAVARLTTFINDDYLTTPIRAWADRRDLNKGGIWSYVAYLLGCPWCVSAEVGLPSAAAVYAWHAYWEVQIMLLGLAASHVTGMLAVVRDRIEGDS